MNLITILLVIVSLVLTGLILVQQRSSGAGGLFGGGDSGGAFQKRRGMEKILFNATGVFLALLMILAILNLLY